MKYGTFLNFKNIRKSKLPIILAEYWQKMDTQIQIIT